MYVGTIIQTSNKVEMIGISPLRIVQKEKFGTKWKDSNSIQILLESFENY